MTCPSTEPLLVTRGRELEKEDSSGGSVCMRSVRGLATGIGVEATGAAGLSGLVCVSPSLQPAGRERERESSNMIY